MNQIDPVQIGENILIAFSECRENIPHPNYEEKKDGPDHNPILKASGAK